MTRQRLSFVIHSFLTLARCIPIRFVFRNHQEKSALANVNGNLRGRVLYGKFAVRRRSRKN